MTWRRSATRYPLPATRDGFALVEVVVSLVLLSCGALALVAATGMAVRSTTAAERQSAAAAVAQNRVELLAAAGCDPPGERAGAESAEEWIHERWTVSAARNGARVLGASVRYVDQAGPRTLVLERFVVC
jgi:Tfp pilus assembly protein PilV